MLYSILVIELDVTLNDTCVHRLYAQYGGQESRIYEIPVCIFITKTGLDIYPQDVSYSRALSSVDTFISFNLHS